MPAAGNVTVTLVCLCANDMSLPLCFGRSHAWMFAVIGYSACMCAVPYASEAVGESADLHLHTWFA